MNFKINLILLLQLLSIGIFAQITPKISAVKVFSQGAEIKRSQNIQIKQGIDTIKISGISPYINNNTIQAKIPGVKILDVKFTINYLKETKDEPKLKQLKSSIRQIDLDVLNIKDQLEYLQIEYDLILVNQSIKGNSTLDVDDVKDFVFYYKSKLPELIKKITDNKHQLGKFQDVRNKLAKQQNELQKVKSSKTGEIEILVQSGKSTKSKLNISYHVYKCGWQPLYNMRASNIDLPINFEYNAMVFQNTAVNWDGIELTIATGNPVLNGNKPHLNPWRLNQQSLSYFNANLRLDNYKSDEIVDDLNKDSEDKENQINRYQKRKVVQTQNLTFSSFQVPQLFSLNTGSGEKRVTLLKRDLPATFHYYSIPKVNNDVFLVAEVTQLEKMPLIPGKYHIYFDETFVGKSFLNPKIMEDTFAISLGKDQSILVDRVKQEEKCMNNSTILGAVKKRGYQITVKNNRNKAISIEVLDQVPISKNNKIKVDYKLGKGLKINEETGILEWNLEIPANTKQSTFFEFEVKHPKKLNIAL